MELTSVCLIKYTLVCEQVHSSDLHPFRGMHLKMNHIRQKKKSEVMNAGTSD